MFQDELTVGRAFFGCAEALASPWLGRRCLTTVLVSPVYSHAIIRSAAAWAPRKAFLEIDVDHPGDMGPRTPPGGGERVDTGRSAGWGTHRDLRGVIANDRAPGFVHCMSPSVVFVGRQRGNVAGVWSGARSRAAAGVEITS